MRTTQSMIVSAAAMAAFAAPATTAWAATATQVGASGKTFASDAVQCTVDPSGVLGSMVQAGLLDPRRGSRAVVWLDGNPQGEVTFADPVMSLPLDAGVHTVVVALGRKATDSYPYTVDVGQCSTAGNRISADGTLEYAASGKSSATVDPGCAWSAAAGQPRRYVNLFDNGGFLLNVSVNGVPLTQLSALKPHTPVFLGLGWNVIAAANASLSTDYYVRYGGDAPCVLPQ